jgi:transposase
MNVRYRVTLSDEERTQLQALVARGRPKVREVKRAQLLLAADGGTADVEIARAVSTSAATVYRTKRCFVEEGLAAALHDAPRPGGARKLSGKEAALLIATACAAPPEGRACWTLELLAGEMVRLTAHASLSGATVGRRLAENKLKPWREKMWCIPKINSEYVARMADVLDLYAAPADPKRPVLSLDETPIQLIGESRVPLAPEPGKPRRCDYEYVRHGTANLFVCVDVNQPWRRVKVTERRTKEDFAAFVRELVDLHYAEADCVRIVLDNLSTHTAAALYDTFDPAEARRILRRVEFHYVPKHASWLNMVEIEIGVLKMQCLDRRIPDVAIVRREISAWEKTRNEAGARIEWMFTVERARQKLGRVYRQLETARLGTTSQEVAQPRAA